ncbi:MAG: prolyl-tRNA synthetase associated domain-containing protein [Kiloniellales bacterium]
MGEEKQADSAPALLADGSAATTAEALFQRLEELGIASQTVDHPPLFTVEESKALRGSLPGHHVKNLFLRNKKGVMWLLTCLEDREIDLKRLGAVLNAGRFSFGSAERLMHYLGVRPGAVTPLAVINDRQHKVTMVLDSALTDGQPVNAHPLVNDRTTTLGGRDLLRFLEAEGHAPRLLDFENL